MKDFNTSITTAQLQWQLSVRLCEHNLNLMSKRWEIREEKVIWCDRPWLRHSKKFSRVCPVISDSHNLTHLIDLPLFSLFGIIRWSSVQPLVTSMIQFLHLVWFTSLQASTLKEDPALALICQLLRHYSPVRPHVQLEYIWVWCLQGAHSSHHVTFKKQFWCILEKSWC